MVKYYLNYYKQAYKKGLLTQKSEDLTNYEWINGLFLDVMNRITLIVRFGFAHRKGRQCGGPCLPGYVQLFSCW